MTKFLLKMLDLTDSLLMIVISIMLGEIKDILMIIGICITAFYTLWKWRVEYFDRLKKKYPQQ